MTRYTVVWHGSAQDELAELWIKAPDRNAVTAAAHLIDVELSQDVATKEADKRSRADKGQIRGQGQIRQRTDKGSEDKDR
jgi:hypothetical protein